MANTPDLFQQLQVKEQQLEAIRDIVLFADIEAQQDPQEPAPTQKRPWEAVSPDKLHPFTVHMTEQLFQKMGYCWKRSNHQSAKSFLIAAVEEACAKTLKDLGEAP